MSIIAAGYALLPDLFLYPFEFKAKPEEFAVIKPICVVLLRFVAFYSIFDVLNLVFAAAVKGAGDTKYVMWVCVICSWIVMVIPTYFTCVVLNQGLYIAWIWLTLYVCIIGLLFLKRFLGGKWKSMRVIDTTPHIPPSITPPAVPISEAEV
jgi:MATE family multidrug resistance protein